MFKISFKGIHFNRSHDELIWLWWWNRYWDKKYYSKYFEQYFSSLDDYDDCTRNQYEYGGFIANRLNSIIPTERRKQHGRRKEDSNS